MMMAGRTSCVKEIRKRPVRKTDLSRCKARPYDYRWCFPVGEW